MNSFNQTSNPQYSEFIALSRYARWLPEENRRETWKETVSRLTSFWLEKYPFLKEEGVIDKLHNAILNLEIMPSMRSLMTAGEALDRDEVAGYNCSFRAIGSGTKTVVAHSEEFPDEEFIISIRDVKSFDEIIYVLMCGVGVGFSVERQFIANLPTIGRRLSRKIYQRTEENYPGVEKKELSTFSHKYNTIYVADSKYGWASAYRILITELYNGNFDVKWDVSAVRPEGAPLKTFGGRASGPRPLEDLFTFTSEIFKGANERRLSSIECHDLVCKIAEIVVVGGVRRSALLSLSNLTDQRMAVAKSGAWWENDGQRALANNSVCYTEKPDIGIFMKEWINLYESKSGERGIFNREAAEKSIPERRQKLLYKNYGTNPCSEIILRDQQFCNLSEVVVRENDTWDTLTEKVKLATILGTLQATLTDFKYLNPEWVKNTKEEALLGISLTGIMDHPVLSDSEEAYYFEQFGTFGEDQYNLKHILEKLKDEAIKTNQDWANKLNINPATATTCVKISAHIK